MRIHALMCTRNEAGRYLEEALTWLLAQVDSVLVYDDGSTDDTEKLVTSFHHPDLAFVSRGETTPTFMEHEGMFRTASLRVLEQYRRPDEGDWVFIADADEFYVPASHTLRELAAYATASLAVRIRIHTVWGYEDRHLVHRIDNAWSTLYEPRLWRWLPGGEFANKAMACRNEPTYITQNTHQIATPSGVESAILHFGYASAADREERYKRYSSLADHGHHPPMIESIMDERVVTTPWAHTIPATPI
jgi:hypothetical protein